MFDAGGDAGPDGEGAGVAERAVADVLDQVRFVDERRQPDPRARPRRPSGWAARLVMPGVAGLEVHDPVAADAAADERAVGDDASSGCAGSRCRSPGARRGTLDAAADSVRVAAGVRGARERRAAPGRGSVATAAGVELADRGRQRLAVAVALAHAPATVLPRLVEDAAQLGLDERPLLLDDHDLVDRRRRTRGPSPRPAGRSSPASGSARRRRSRSSSVTPRSASACTTSK